MLVTKFQECIKTSIKCNLYCGSNIEPIKIKEGCEKRELQQQNGIMKMDVLDNEHGAERAYF